MSTKRILLGLGGTDFTPVAIQRAVGLAEHHDAEITGVTVVDESRLRRVGPVPAGAGGAARDLREHRVAVTQQQIEEATDSLRDQCNDKGLRFQIIHEKGEPFALMSNLANYHDVMIFGLRSIFDYGLGFDPKDTLSRLVGAGISPCIAVSRQYREIRRVLLTYSGSVGSAKAVKRFVQSRLWPDVTFRLLACADTSEQAKRLLEEMATYCRAHGYEPEVEDSTEVPNARILPAAEEWNADLIVLSISGQKLWLQKILGDTTLHTIRNAERPLFLSH